MPRYSNASSSLAEGRLIFGSSTRMKRAEIIRYNGPIISLELFETLKGILHLHLMRNYKLNIDIIYKIKLD